MAEGESGARNEALEAGADEVVIKSPEAGEIVAIVKKILA